MSFGISVKNDSGHILISDEIESLHFAGEATHVTTKHTGLLSFPSYNSTNSKNKLSGRCIDRYKIRTSQMPVFFILPRDSSRFHGVLNQWRSGNAWYVDVIKSGDFVWDKRPRVFAFTSATGLSPSGNYGIKVSLKSGATAFDSRLKPLAIKVAKLVKPKTQPCDGGTPGTTNNLTWNDSNLDHDFTCDDSFTETPIQGSTSNLMFSAPGIAQAVYSRERNGHKASTIPFWLGGGTQHHYSKAVWWAMYHQGYTIHNNKIRAGWCVYDAGYFFESEWEGEGWFGKGGGSSILGSRPYTDKTINLRENTIIVVDAAHYI